MPISEDEFDSRQGYERDDQHHSTLSKAELRKTNKPIMEKKRRARINQCLGELKDLILEAMKKDPARHSKLEKADILEMTVRHLQAIQRRSLAAAAAVDPAVLPRFREGFTECAAEATKFLARSSSLTPPARARLRQHLSSCIAALNQPPVASSMPHDFNGNIHVGGVPLIPSRLPTGELALVLPANSQLPFPPPMSDFLMHKDHVSAFQTVRNANRPPSPTSSVTSCDSVNSGPTTPPSKNLSSVFPTPPSQTSSTECSPETQKPTVSSTTASPVIKIEDPKTVKLEKEYLGETRWKQIDECSYKQLTPPSLNSSTEYIPRSGNISPKIALDYSMTPSTGKKRAYPMESTVLLKVARRTESPTQTAKIACAQVSSSQSGENDIRPRSFQADLKDGRLVERNERFQAGSSGSKPPGGADMWRPW